MDRILHGFVLVNFDRERKIRRFADRSTAMGGAEKRVRVIAYLGDDSQLSHIARFDDTSEFAPGGKNSGNFILLKNAKFFHDERLEIDSIGRPDARSAQISDKRIAGFPFIGHLIVSGQILQTAQQRPTDDARTGFAIAGDGFLFGACARGEIGSSET
uniref:Uncharacterized protein n=1 Tax=Romanomermis culicivorax TaxID=13658 RepID=A0A915J6G7_ROMCU